MLCTHYSIVTHETEECPTVQLRRKRRVEEATFGWLEEIPNGRREFVGILLMAPVGMVINVGFITSAQSVQDVIQGSSAGELVLQRKGLLRWVVDPFRSVVLNFEQRGTGIQYRIQLQRICKENKNVK